jgi:hypothetical protein
MLRLLQGCAGTVRARYAAGAPSPQGTSLIHGPADAVWFETRPRSRARSSVAPGSRRGAIGSVPLRPGPPGQPKPSKVRASWHAGTHLGRELNPSPCRHLRAAFGLRASVPPKRAGAFFSKFLAPFPRFALDHTHHECRKAPPRAVGPWIALTGPGIRAPPPQHRLRGRAASHPLRLRPGGRGEPRGGIDTLGPPTGVTDRGSSLWRRAGRCPA